MWNFIVGGTCRIYGVLFVEFQEMFHSSPSQTGMMGLVCGLSCIVVSPVAGWLSDRYSVRMMGIVGGVIATTGILLTGFALNLPVAIVTYGIIYGMAMSIMDGPLLAMLSKYFKHHLNLANGIAFTGSSLGNLTLGHVMAVAIETYAPRGAIIILAAVWLHSCVVSALMRPFVSGNTEEEINSCGLNEREATPKRISLESASEYCNNNTSNQIKSENYIEADQPKRKVTGTCPIICKQMQKSEYLNFLRNRRLMLTLLYLGIGYYATTSMLIGFPAYMLETGFSLYDVGWYLFCLGLSEIPGRITMSAVVDRCCSNAALPLAISFAITAVACLTCTFVPQYFMFMIYACIHGWFGGLTAVFTASMLRRCVKVDQMGSAMGLGVMQMHGSSAISSAIIGILKQLTGSYASSLRFGAGIYLIGTIGYLFVHFYSKINKNKKQVHAPVGEKV